MPQDTLELWTPFARSLADQMDALDATQLATGVVPRAVQATADEAATEGRAKRRQEPCRRRREGSAGSRPHAISRPANPLVWPYRLTRSLLGRHP